MKSNQIIGWARILILMAAAFPQLAQAQQTKFLLGHVPPAVARLQSIGLLSHTNRLNLAIGLPLQNKDALTRMLQTIYDAGSTNYHHYLTPGQFTKMFAPTKSQYENVMAFAETNGLSVAGTHSNRLLLDVSGTVSDIQKAFHITLRLYQHPTEARTFYAPDTEPSVDSRLPILNISGLDNYSLKRPADLKTASKTAPMALTGSGPDGLYLGSDFRNAYAPGCSLTGTGQAVGLYEADGYYTNDIATYEETAGLTNDNIVITNILIDGFSGKPGSGNDEDSLDIEMVMAMAPGAKIIVYEDSPSGTLATLNDTLNRMASDDAASQLSSSWYWSDDTNAATEQIFLEFAAQGQTFFQASGDEGAYNGANSANSPCASPNIVTVGGTGLKTTNGLWKAESVWNFSGSSGSGGGTSVYPIPAWQQGIDMAVNGGSTNVRNIPDVAMAAAYIWSTRNNGGSGGMSGTSCSTPLWAAFTALANEQAAAYDRPPVGFLNPAIYAIGLGKHYSSDFHDIKAGNNTNNTSSNEYFAAPGYDLCTGWGSPNGTNLINALVGPPDAFEILPLNGFTTTGPAGGPFNVTAQDFSLTNAGPISLNWSITTTCQWLNVSAASGSLAADTQTNIVVGLSDSAAGLAPGVYTGNVLFTNLSTRIGQERPFILQVTQPFTVNPALGYTAGGPPGGPFNFTSQTFLLSNSGTIPIDWSVSNPAMWLDLAPDGGTLTPGQQTVVRVSLNSASSNLIAGIYVASLSFTNQTDGGEQNCPFTLLVGQPPVENGGFETGDFMGWTLNGDANFDFVDDGSLIVPHSGDFAAALGDPLIGTISQTVPVFQGQAYVLSLWLDSPDGETPNQFSVAWNGNTLFNETNIAAIGWTNLQFAVTASTPDAALQIGFRDDPSYLGLDDVNLTEVPVPVIWQTTEANGALQLQWSAQSGLVYQLQYSTNLLDPIWTKLGSTITATNSTVQLSETNNMSSQCFYRIILIK